jgi:hypothetical protein
MLWMLHSERPEIGINQKEAWKRPVGHFMPLFNTAVTDLINLETGRITIQLHCNINASTNKR